MKELTFEVNGIKYDGVKYASKKIEEGTIVQVIVGNTELLQYMENNFSFRVGLLPGGHISITGSSFGKKNLDIKDGLINEIIEIEKLKNVIRR